MPRALRKSKPRRRVARKPMRRRRVARKSNVAEYASCSVKRTITGPAGAPFTSNQMYEVHNVQLADYARALTVSAAYQFYRIKHVRITYKFPYDTYAQGLGANISRPNFYYMLDKAQAIPLAINLEGLKQMGARPRQVDEKPISISWSPTVLTEDETTVGPLPSQYKTSPWLSSDVQNVLHNGVYWYVDQQFAPVGGIAYQAEIEVQFEFKKPLWKAEEGAPLALTAKVAVENNSADGVVGGADEGMNQPSGPL